MSVQQLIARRAAERPEAVAVVTASDELTYRRLDQRANQLAWHLVDHGVGPEALVAVALDRSADVVVALLGVLRAGGAYLPLDPSHPAERLAFVVDDARPAVMVTCDRAGGQLEALIGPTVDLRDTDRRPTHDPGRPFDPGHLAYVIYTSGSTGRPKGVEIEHRGLTNLVRAQIDRFGITPRSRILQVAPLSFDASVSEIFATLCAGATLVVPQPSDLLPGALEDVVARHDVTTMTVAPSLLAALDEHRMGRSLQTLVTAGEAVTAAVVEPWVERVCVLNAYGPTETTVCATITDRLDAGRPPPLGDPITGARLLVVDDAGELVPAEGVGELCVGGPGVARGYRGRPRLTAEAFVPDPFHTGQRLYRTGDLVRRSASGELFFVGRRDAQVKVRGFRIEPGEVEACVGQHPAVRHAVVTATTAGPESELVGHVVLRESLGAAELRRFCRQRLPDYMVPNVFVAHRSFPRSPHGKVDRRALASAVGERLQPTPSIVGPQSPLEHTIARLAAELLGLDEVGLHDNFFDLGAHSLLVGRLVARVGGACGVTVPARVVFEAPTVARLAQVVQDLVASSTQSSPIEPATDEGSVGLSFAQQRLWFIDRLAGGTAAYNVPLVVRLRGRLEVEALRTAVHAVTTRHEVLRSRATVVAGQPVLEIDPEWTGELRLVEGSAQDVEGCVAAEVRQPFDLEEGPLLRGLLVRVAPEDHVLVVTVHHLVFDGWSVGVFHDAVGELYDAALTGREPNLEPPPVHYRDYAVWQRRWLDSGIADQQLTWWHDHLAGATTVLELPADRPRPPVQTMSGAQHRFRVSAPVATELRGLARRHDATFFMVLLTALDVLLHRYTGQSDLLVGTPVANRNHHQLDRLLGHFANTLVIRVDTSGDPTFLDLLDRVKQATVGAYAHQDLPFERLVEDLAPARDASRSPLVQVLLVAPTGTVPHLALTGLECQPLDVDLGTSRLDLTVTFADAADGGLSGSFEYSSDLFDAATVDHWATSLATLLGDVAARPGEPVRHLRLVSPGLQRWLVDDLNDTDSPLPAVCVHDLVAEQAARRPDAVAVTDGSDRLTYRQLDERANQLAWHLLDHGIGPEVPVAVALERSLDLVVGLLGVLKAGGAYVPIDAAYPAERIASMVADAAPVALLTTPALAARLPPFRSGPTLHLSDARGRPTTAPAGGAQPGHLAYITFTSGSTGRPKGVEIEHRSIVRLVRSRWAGVEPAEVVLGFAPLSFDASTFEVWSPLANGAVLALAPGRPSIHDLADFVKAQRVTVLWLTAGLFHLLVDVGAGDLHSVRRLVAGGDVLSPTHVTRLGQDLPTCQLVNGYGPTESTTFACMHPVDRSRSDTSVPLGSPIENTRVVVLDPHGELTPVGVVGELCIGGIGLARGYRGRPRLTAEAFVPDPFRRGERLYRTGDLVRRTATGDLQFLGRRDAQVKIRGFRVEPAEVEACLSHHPSVRDVAVLAPPGPDGRTLVGHLVLDEPETVEALRGFCRQRLPEYMVPSAFLLHESVPLSPNGKVDRAALAELPGRRLLPQTSAAARSTVERTIAELVERLLDIDHAGVHDNFFDLGGTSMLLLRLQHALEQTFDVPVPLVGLVEHATVAAMAAWLSAGTGDQPTSRGRPVRDRGPERRSGRLQVRQAEGRERERRG